jgi:MinD-like ATPase involved in chromosome partitioning or flagellar assembly
MFEALAQQRSDSTIKQAVDQADGLRRLFKAQSLRVLPVSGSWPLVELLARALAGHSRVAVIDEEGAAVLNAFQKTAPYELTDLLSGQRQFHEVAVRINDQLSLIAAQTGLQKFLHYANENSLTGTSLFAGFMNLSRPFRWLLINTLELKSAATLVRNEGEMLFVIPDTPAGIHQAYTQIKQAALNVPELQLRIAVQSDSDSQGKRAFQCLAQTTERFFQIQPQFALTLPKKWKVNAAMGQKLRIAMSSWNLAEYVQNGVRE